MDRHRLNLRSGETRLGDSVALREALHSGYSSLDMVSLGVPAGTVIFDDTRGVRPGRPIIHRHRRVPQLAFSLDQFGSLNRLRPGAVEDLFGDMNPSDLWPRLGMQKFGCDPVTGKMRTRSALQRQGSTAGGRSW